MTGFLIIALLFSSSLYASQDLVAKRRNIAEKAVIYSTQIVDGYNALLQTQDEYNQAGTFVQTDFDGTGLSHLTPGMINTLFGGGGVAENLKTNYTDAANSGRNKQILLQMRK